MKAYGNGFTIVAAMRGVDLPDPDRRLHIPTPRTPSPTPTPPALSALSASSIRTDSSGPLERPDPPTAPAPPAPPVLPAPLTCEGCGLPVAAEYTARTGCARHGCCPPTATTTSTPDEEAGVDAGLAAPAATGTPA